jgi:hypothetical protein
VLAFAAAPDYEAEADADTDNSYEVTVEVSDGINSDSIDVTITVTNVGLDTPYDADDSGVIEKGEVITSINDYLDGGTDAPTKAEVIRLIDLYLGA